MARRGHEEIFAVIMLYLVTRLERESRMNEAQDWRTVYDFWFPPGLNDTAPDTYRRMFVWWFDGEANAGLPPFVSMLEAARTGRLDY